LLLSVTIFVVITTLIAAFWLAPRLLPRDVIVDNSADAPRSFGSDMAWLAVRTRDAEAVIRALGLSDLRPANWNSGLGTVYDGEFSDVYVFVSPPIDGWTVVAGVSLPMPSASSFVDKASPLLRRLSAVFSEVQYFATFPAIDFYSWADFVGGRCVRSFAATEAGIVWDSGRLTLEEQRLGLSFIEVRRIEDRHGDIGGTLILHPTERHVLSVAAAWGIDPMSLNTNNARAGAGWIGRSPSRWRPERRRGAAA
jgi:hypothetical protein